MAEKIVAQISILCRINSTGKVGTVDAYLRNIEH